MLTDQPNLKEHRFFQIVQVLFFHYIHSTISRFFSITVYSIGAVIAGRRGVTLFNKSVKDVVEQRTPACAEVAELMRNTFRSRSAFDRCIE